MPVREAFRVLEMDGLIRGSPRRKTAVVAVQPEDVEGFSALGGNSPTPNTHSLVEKRATAR
jgi:DNA-binding FadR family transcriptional regulator